jgi:hypothetical protein
LCGDWRRRARWARDRWRTHIPDAIDGIHDDPLDLTVGRDAEAV